MISICTTTFDINGRVVIPVRGSTEGPVRRRVSRVATLDQGVAVNDGGYSDGDRDLEYVWPTVSAGHNESLSRILKLYPRVFVCTPSGVFLAVPQEFTAGHKESSITLLAIEKVSA